MAKREGVRLAAPPNRQASSEVQLSLFAATPLAGQLETRFLAVAAVPMTRRLARSVRGSALRWRTAPRVLAVDLEAVAATGIPPHHFQSRRSIKVRARAQPSTARVAEALGVVDERLYQEHERDHPEHSNDHSDREDGKEHAHDRSFLLTYESTAQHGRRHPGRP